MISRKSIVFPFFIFLSNCTLGEKSNLPASFTLRRDKAVAHYGQSLAKSADSSSVEYGYTLPRIRLDLAATLPRTASTVWIEPFSVTKTTCGVALRAFFLPNRRTQARSNRTFFSYQNNLRR